MTKCVDIMQSKTILEGGGVIFSGSVAMSVQLNAFILEQKSLNHHVGLGLTSELNLLRTYSGISAIEEELQRLVKLKVVTGLLPLERDNTNAPKSERVQRFAEWAASNVISACVCHVSESQR